MVNRLENSLTPNATNVTTASGEVMAANSARRYAIFTNDSDQVIYLSLGGTAVINKGIRLNANGGSYEIKGENLFVGSVKAIHAGSGNKVLTHIEDATQNN